jgi:hypothetical protein
MEARRDKSKAVMDHDDDTTCFEISIVNKRNMAINIDCKTHDGEVTFGKVHLSA